MGVTKREQGRGRSGGQSLSLWKRGRKRVRQGYVKLLRSPGAPAEVARGMSLGLFLAMLPIIQTPVAVGVAETMRRVFKTPVSRVAAILGCCFTNPLTGGPIYGLAILLGRPFARLVLPEGMISAEGTKLAMSLSSAGPFAVELLVSLLIGGVLIGVPLAIAGYRITHALVARYQARRAVRQQRVVVKKAARSVPLMAL